MNVLSFLEDNGINVEEFCTCSGKPFHKLQNLEAHFSSKKDWPHFLVLLYFQSLHKMEPDTYDDTCLKPVKITKSKGKTFFKSETSLQQRVDKITSLKNNSFYVKG